MEENTVDLLRLSWSDHQQNRSISLSAQEVINRKRYYYKLPDYDAETDSFRGHLTVNEAVVSRLLDLLGIHHVRYELLNARIRLNGCERTVPVCRSENFCRENEEQICFDTYYNANRLPMETTLDFCRRNGLEDFLCSMLATDYIIMNRDRYANNIIILRNKLTGAIRPAPLFDHGISLLYECWTDEELAAFDVMKDRFSLNYIGLWFVSRNLKLIPKDRYPDFRVLTDTDRDYLFSGLEPFLTPLHREKIWEMITKRMTYFRAYPLNS